MSKWYLIVATFSEFGRQEFADHPNGIRVYEVDPRETAQVKLHTEFSIQKYRLYRTQLRRVILIPRRFVSGVCSRVVHPERGKFYQNRHRTLVRCFLR